MAGPYATQLLGDAGAQICKIEPLTGDGTRVWGPPFVSGNEEDTRTATYFFAANRNKMSLALNLKHADGIKIAQVSEIRTVYLRPMISLIFLLFFFCKGSCIGWGGQVTTKSALIGLNIFYFKNNLQVVVIVL